MVACGLALPFALAMESDLSQLGDSLSLTEEQEVGLLFPTGLWHAEPLAKGFFIVSRLVSSKSFKPEALQNTFKLAFNTVRGLELKIREEALDDPNLVDLNWCEFHIQIYSLPLGKMINEISAFIGTKLGRFKDIDLGSSGEAWGSSVRVRVAIDITKPLKWALKVRIVLGDDHLITFTYE
ncbi:UNVERIFIED_CONTAM: hypothetical protein Sradi_3185200 [Sesamum radiatum]|uniref:Uncharacterized protein n=1 Tax=Sesamum radiatum TaxID=300843 RepID=A0AAW2RF36_SESRA